MDEYALDKKQIIENLYPLALDAFDDLMKTNRTITYLKICAENGYAPALGKLGFLYSERIKDIKQAEYWYNKAHEVGDQNAEHYMRSMKEGT